MIKIPEHKYKSLEGDFFSYTQLYVEDTIRFYINCCKIQLNIMSANQYKDRIKTYKHSSSLLALIKILSDPFRISAKAPGTAPVVKTVEDVFNKGLINTEFVSQAATYLPMLEDMLNPSKFIYYQRILLSKPDQLVNIYNQICMNYATFKTSSGVKVFMKSGMEKGLLSNIFNNIFNYDKFSSEGFKSAIRKGKWSAYDLCNELNVNVCPYCNRMYTFTVYKLSTGKALTRPELDHYMPQSKFPLFRLSFYNLIPSCKVCNSSFKRDTYMAIDTYLHPYLNEIHTSYKFDYEPITIEAFSGDKKDINVKINKNGIVDIKTDNSLAAFGIEEIYKNHNDVVADLILRRQRYSDTKIKEITDLFNREGGQLVNVEEIYSSIFHSPKESELIDCSLGKLRTDIIEKLRTLN